MRAGRAVVLALLVACVAAHPAAAAPRFIVGTG
jgi:hypothetical protein